MAIPASASPDQTGTGTRVLVGAVFAVVLLFAGMYSSTAAPSMDSSITASMTSASATGGGGDSSLPLPPPTAGAPTTATDGPAATAAGPGTGTAPLATPGDQAKQPASATAGVSDMVWLRGTGGRLEHKSGCAVIPSLGFWRARCSAVCSADAGAKRSVELSLAAAAVAVKAARCSGPGCTGKADLAVAKGSSAGRWVVELGPCSADDTPAAPKPIREGDVSIDVAVSAADAATLANTRTCFLTIGDWGRDSANELSVAAGMTRVIAEDAGVRFVVSTGDNFYPTGVKGPTDPHFNKTFETPFASPELREMLWLISAGNHDQWGIAGQVQYSLTEPPLKDTRLPRSERWYFPKPVYSLEVPVTPKRSARFVVLNSYGRQVPGTLKFMQTEMEAALKGESRGTAAALKAKQAAGTDGAAEKVPVDLAWEAGAEAWRIVINHAPLWSGSRHGQERKETPPVRRLIRPAVDAAKVHGYFSGHDHVLEVHRDVGTDYFVSGGGGGSKTDPSKEIATTKYFNAKGDVGFMRHCFVGDEMRTSLFATDGKAPAAAPKEIFTYTTPLEYTAGEEHTEAPVAPPTPKP